MARGETSAITIWKRVTVIPSLASSRSELSRQSSCLHFCSSRADFALIPSSGHYSLPIASHSCCQVPLRSHGQRLHWLEDDRGRTRAEDCQVFFLDCPPQQYYYRSWVLGLRAWKAYHSTLSILEVELGVLPTLLYTVHVLKAAAAVNAGAWNVF